MSEIAKYLKGKHPDLWFFLIAIVILFATAGFGETIKFVFLLVVSVVWIAIIVSSKWSNASLVALLMYLSLWIYIFKVK